MLRGWGSPSIYPIQLLALINPVFRWISLNYSFLFIYGSYIYYKGLTMKRRYRELTEETKAKISRGTTGRTLSPETRKKISESMVRYWKGIPHRPNETEGGVI